MCQASSAQWSNAAHCWVRSHPIKEKAHELVKLWPYFVLRIDDGNQSLVNIITSKEDKQFQFPT